MLPEPWHLQNQPQAQRVAPTGSVSAKGLWSPARDWKAPLTHTGPNKFQDENHLGRLL